MVILGHIKGFWFPIYRFVYTFHMPLFFMISGYLFKSSDTFKGLMNYVLKLSKRLMIPYLVFLPLMNFLLDMPYSSRDLFYGGGGLMGGLGIAWFVTDLFISLCIFQVLHILKLVKIWMAILLLIIAYLLSDKIPPLWGGNIVPMSIVYVYCGHYIKLYESRINNSIRNKVIFDAMFLLGLFVLGCFVSSVRMDMKHANYGIPVISFTISVIASVSLAKICQSIKRKNMIVDALCFCGRNSFSLMLIHLYIIMISYVILPGDTILFGFARFWLVLSICICCIVIWNQSKKIIGLWLAKIR